MIVDPSLWLSCHDLDRIGRVWREMKYEISRWKIKSLNTGKMNPLLSQIFFTIWLLQFGLFVQATVGGKKIWTLKVSASFCLNIYRPKIAVKDYFRERIDTVILKWMFPTASYYIFRRNVFVFLCSFNESNLNGLIIFQISNDLYFDRCPSWPRISNTST